jgi:hypothetical protein
LLTVPRMRDARSALVETRGSSFVEYLVVVGFCALLIGPTIYALGLPLLRWFRFTQLVLLSPV